GSEHARAPHVRVVRASCDLRFARFDRCVLLVSPAVKRTRCGWNQSPDRLGCIHHELRILGRYRPLGNSHFRGIVSLSRQVSYVDLPSVRGNDGFRGYDRRAISDYSHRTSVVCGVLALPLSKSTNYLAELSLAASLG